MKIMDPSSIKYDHSILLENRDLMMVAYRKMIFSKKSVSLFKSFIKSYQNLERIFKLKNAQHEAVCETDVKKYVKNLGVAYNYILKKISNEEEFSGHQDLVYLHKLIDPDSYAKNPGGYRNQLIKVGQFYPPEPNKIYSLVDNIFYNMQQLRYSQLKAIYFHHECVRVHPFVDGNGRTARVVKNWIIMHDLYPPDFITTPEDKMRYIDILERSFMGLDSNPYQANEATEEFFNQELLRINKSIKFLLMEM